MKHSRTRAKKQIMWVLVPVQETFLIQRVSHELRSSADCEPSTPDDPLSLVWRRNIQEFSFHLMWELQLQDHLVVVVVPGCKSSSTPGTSAHLNICFSGVVEVGEVKLGPPAVEAHLHLVALWTWNHPNGSEINRQAQVVIWRQKSVRLRGLGWRI